MVADQTVVDNGDRREQLHAEPQGKRAILGWQLVALGAPQGRKTTQHFGLPCYLGPASYAVRRRFAAIYLLNRGSEHTSRPVLIVREERSRAYLEALAGLFRSLTDAEVWLSGQYKIMLEDAVLSDIDVPKKWNDGAT